MKRLLSLLLVLLLLGTALAACSDEEGTPSDNPTPTQVPISAASASGDAAADSGNGAAALPADVLTIANQRGLTPADVRAAMMTYTPSGKMDEYYLFSSGGQSGRCSSSACPRCASSRTSPSSRPSRGRATATARPSTEAVLDGGNVGRHQDPHGRHAPPRTERDQGRLRRPVPLHQRQGQRPRGRDRPARLRDQADRQGPQPDQQSRLDLRHAQHRVRGRGQPVRHAARLGRMRPSREYKEKYRGWSRSGSSTARRAASTWPSPSASSCRPTGRTCATPASWSPTAGSSATPSTPRWRPAASREATRPSRPASASATWTTCTSSTGRRPPKWSPPARPK